VEILNSIQNDPRTGEKRPPPSLKMLEHLERECFAASAWTAPQIAASLLSPAFRVILIAGDGGVQEYRIDPDQELLPPPPGEPAGYALLQELEGEASCEILRLGILPDFRRRGLALILLEFLDRINANFSDSEESGAPGDSRESRVCHLLLEVSADNTPALRLYRRHGFAELARRRGYYPARNGSGAAVDAVVLRKTISKPSDIGTNPL
jgi:ribosomal-protein-alanine N-acetyltransferase